MIVKISQQSFTFIYKYTNKPCEKSTLNNFLNDCYNSSFKTHVSTRNKKVTGIRSILIKILESNLSIPMLIIRDILFGASAKWISLD